MMEKISSGFIGESRGKFTAVPVSQKAVFSATSARDFGRRLLLARRVRRKYHPKKFRLGIVPLQMMHRPATPDLNIIRVRPKKQDPSQ